MRIAPGRRFPSRLHPERPSPAFEQFERIRRVLVAYLVHSPARKHTKGAQRESKRIQAIEGGVRLKAADLRAPPKSSARERPQRRQVRSSNENMDYPL
jgi:hypothetical protein